VPTAPAELRQRRRKNRDFHLYIRIHGVYALDRCRCCAPKSADATCRITMVTMATIVIVFLNQSTFSQVD
jgi:hypothetical protein